MTKPFFTRIDCDVRLFGTGKDVISLDKANALLRERGKVVEGYLLGESNLEDQHGPGWMMAEPSTRTPMYDKTHKALLICIEPIEQDSAEKILRDFLAIPETYRIGTTYIALSEISDRAKKLLGEG